MKKVTIRRLFAYIIDILIVSIIASAISRVSFLNPRLEKYNELEDEYTNTIIEARNNPELMNELLNDEKINNLTYEVTYNGFYMNIYTVVITFLYFVIFQYYTKGKTLGKKLLKIEMVSEDKKDVTILQLLKRSIIIHSIVTSTVLLIMLSCLSKAEYLKYSNYVQFFDYTVILLSYGFAIYREDGRGLHDMFAKTRVILTSQRDKFFEDSNIKEAKIVEKEVEEVEEVVEKPVKKTTKKKTTTKKTVKKDK